MKISLLSTKRAWSVGSCNVPMVDMAIHIRDVKSITKAAFLYRYYFSWLPDLFYCILAEGAIALPVTLSGGALFAS